MDAERSNNVRDDVTHPEHRTVLRLFPRAETGRHVPKLVMFRGRYHVTYWEGQKRLRFSLATRSVDKARALFAEWKKPAGEPRRASSELVYFAQTNCTIGFIKIGVASDVAARLRSIQIACPYEVRLLATMKGGVAKEAELHRLFVDAHVRGEWFRPTPALLALIASERQWSAAQTHDPITA